MATNHNQPLEQEELLREMIARERPRPVVPPAPAPRTHGFTLSPSKIAAGIVWCGAVYTTYLTVDSLQPTTPLPIAVGLALLLQFVFTATERSILTGRPDVIACIVFAFDALINAGGIFPALVNIGKTPSAQMLAAAGTPADVGAIPAILFALLIGGSIAVAPEALWKIK